jgi:hypothetical protein
MKSARGSARRARRCDSTMIENIRDEILRVLEKNILLKYLETDDDKVFDEDEHKKEVLEELSYHIGDHLVSDLMLSQLVDLHGKNYTEIDGKKHPYNITSVYWRMEDIINEKEKPKEFRNKSSKLFGKGIYHIHHSQSFYIEDNHIRFFKNKYKDNKSVIARIQEIAKLYPNNEPIPTFVYETLLESLDWDKKTGEWILFQKIDRKIYFIGLALHNSKDNNDELLFAKIRDYIK